jgi:hypothetical protein
MEAGNSGEYNRRIVDVDTLKRRPFPIILVEKYTVWYEKKMYRGITIGPMADGRPFSFTA